MHVTGRFKALLLLVWSMLQAVVRRLFGGRRGLVQFRVLYDPDGLPPIDGEERRQMPQFSRCVACGLCDRGEAERIASSGGAYRGVMSLVLAASRSMPDYRAAAYSFSFVSDDVLAEKERVCPTGVPFRRLARFVRDKADAVGGAWPLPVKLRSLTPQ